MKKTLLKRLTGIFLATVIVVACFPALHSEADNTYFYTDSEGNSLIHNYEELRKAAQLGSYFDGKMNQFVLANTINCEDSKNDYEIIIEDKSFYLDLNGFVITRISRSVDENMMIV